MRTLIALLSGSLFGAGLFVSDMIDPGRVLAFLDLASGAWDPTLAFVMAGALIPMALAWRLTYRRTEPLSGGTFPPSPRQDADGALLGGAALFGIGWGLSGFCPGPALSSAGFGGPQVWLFLAAMLAGMALAPRLTALATTRAASGTG